MNRWNFFSLRSWFIPLQTIRQFFLFILFYFSASIIFLLKMVKNSHLKPIKIFVLSSRHRKQDKLSTICYQTTNFFCQHTCSKAMTILVEPLWTAIVLMVVVLAGPALSSISADNLSKSHSLVIARHFTKQHQRAPVGTEVISYHL